MTVSSQNSRIEQLGDGTTTAFAVNFYFLENSDLKVFVNGLLQTITTNYTVTGAGNPAGGTVTFVTAPANGVEVVIFRDPALTQGLDYIDNDPFPAESHERGLDKLTMIAQRVKDLVSRALRLGDSVVGVNTELPALTGSQLLGTKPDGTGFQLYPLGSTPQDAASTIYTPAGTGAVATSVEDILDAQLMVDYAALRAYTGLAKTVRITGLLTTAQPQGIAGFFQFDSTDTTSADNGGTIIVGADGRRWKRVYNGPLNVQWFGAVGNGTTNDTTAINNAIAYAKSLVKGGEVYFPQPTVAYAVTEINMTSATSDFTKTVKLSGDGRWRSRIIPFSSGTVLLNMLGMNNAVIQGLHFDSSNLASQAAIFMARSTTSGNCNNNKFYDTWVTGSFTVAAVVCNGSESSYWFGGRIENGNVAANHRCLWTGGGSLIGGLQGITVVNGGTVSNVNNPNTDNKMFGVEFYAPFADARPVRVSQSCGYFMIGCTVIVGNGANARMVTYADASGGRVNCQVAWEGCHFEGTSATNVIVHFLDVGGSTSEVIFKGISSKDCAVVVNASATWIDFDRTNRLFAPSLENCDIGAIDLPPNITGLDSYATILRRSSFRQPGARLNVFSFLSQSELDVQIYRGTDVASLGKIVEFGVAGLPTTGTYVRGTTLTRQDSTAGQPVGYKVTVSGTLGTLNGGATTLAADATASSVLTFNTTTGLETGQKISIGGTLVWVRKIDGTTVYVSGNVTQLAGTAVSYSPPTIVALPNL